MYPQLFEIRIDNETKKFYAGQIVEGKVVLALQKEKVIRGIDIRLTGKGNVYWDAGIKHNHVYSDSEVYLSKTLNLMIPEDGRQTVLHPGTYEYYFSIPLPAKIPSSVEGQNCFIRYYIEAAILRPWKEEQTVQIMFYVTSISDLNISPHAKEPTSFQKQKHVGFNLCQTGPISFNFMIGKTGFVPGEYLQFGVEIRNQSGTRINGVNIAFKRLMTCHAKGETKSTHDKLLQIRGPSAEISGYLLWQSNFEIPAVPPTRLIGCQIINMQYYVEIKLALEKWVDVKFNMPVIIGTIPFRSNGTSQHLEYPPPPTMAEHEPKAKALEISAVASPTVGAEFKFDDPWGSLIKHPFGNGIAPLPALDLTFFQSSKPERHPHFKSFEDCDCEFSYPYRLTSSASQQELVASRPPRPHSNPGHFWERSADYWDQDDENEDE